MVSLDRRFICQTIFSCCSVCVLGLALVVAILCFEIRSTKLGAPIEIDGAQVIGMDWEKEPFFSVKLLKITEKCPETYPEPFLYDVWLGL